MNRITIKIPVALIIISLLLLSPAGSFAENKNDLYWGPMQYHSYKQENAIACNKDVFVIIGNKGLIETSIDGFNWTEQQSGTSMDLSSIIWDGRQFVVFGDPHSIPDAANTIFTSLDGKEWTHVEPVGLPPRATITKALWANNKIIISSYSTGIYTSDDIINWKPLINIGKKGDYGLPVQFYHGYESVATDGKKVIAISDGFDTLDVYDQKYEEMRALYVYGLSGKRFYNIEWNGEEFLAWGVKTEEGTTVSGMIFNTYKFYLAKSTDGYSWHMSEINESKALTISRGESMEIKPDLFWIKQKPGKIINFSDVAWNGKHFVVLFADREGSYRSSSRIINSVSPINVYLDGKRLNLSVKPVLESDGIYVPMKDTYQALGFKTAWDAKKSTLTATKGKISIKLGAPGSMAARINGKAVFLGSDSRAQSRLIDGNVMIPVGFIHNSLGYKVEYDEKIYTVNIERK